MSPEAMDAAFVVVIAVTFGYLARVSLSEAGVNLGILTESRWLVRAGFCLATFIGLALLAYGVVAILFRY